MGGAAFAVSVGVAEALGYSPTVIERSVLVLLEWHDLALAEAGAVTALTGLVFVALSINLARILSYPGLVGRGGQSVSATGIEILVVTATVAAVILASGSADGMYSLTAGIVPSIVVGIVDAWILLVEILR